MDVFDRRREALRVLLRDIDAAELARRSGIAPSLIARYKADPTKAGSKNLGEENARKLEAAAGRPAYWLDRVHSHAGEPDPGVARPMSQFGPEHAPLMDWGDMMKAETLPRLFWVALPDDSMAPRAPAGKRMCFDTTATAKPGAGVLVRDAAGGVHFRRYVAGPGGRWTAEAVNRDVYAPLDSERDGLTVLAVLVAEWGGWA